MTILSDNNMGQDISFVVVDEDPRITAHDAYEGSLIVYVPDSDYAKPAYFYKSEDGLNTAVVPIIKRHNWEAIIPPAVTDSILAGWDRGSHWYDTVADKMYVCTDNTANAAVWREM